MIGTGHASPDEGNEVDGLFAIAEALHALGNADAATQMGAIENLACEVKVAGESISRAIHELADAIRAHHDNE